VFSRCLQASSALQSKRARLLPASKIGLGLQANNFCLQAQKRFACRQTTFASRRKPLLPAAASGLALPAGNTDLRAGR